jgi:hypothetical protein
MGARPPASPEEVRLKPRYFRERQCARCHDFKPRRKMVYCDICRQWFCEECHRSDHVWQCAED